MEALTDQWAAVHALLTSEKGFSFFLGFLTGYAVKLFSQR